MAIQNDHFDDDDNASVTSNDIDVEVNRTAAFEIPAALMSAMKANGHKEALYNFLRLRNTLPAPTSDNSSGPPSVTSTNPSDTSSISTNRQSHQSSSGFKTDSVYTADTQSKK